MSRDDRCVTEPRRGRGPSRLRLRTKPQRNVASAREKDREAVIENGKIAECHTEEGVVWPSI